jgi:glutamine amidotransferase
MLGYLGSPVALNHLLHEPDSSLIRQTTAPQMLNMMNLAGFGLAAWDEHSHDAQVPFLYRSTQVPAFDRNLKALAVKIRGHAVIAHVRGVPFWADVEVSDQNLHPFRFRDVGLSMAHNGDLAHFDEMRFDLIEHIHPEISRQLVGSTDSEWIYALVLSALEDPAAQHTPDELIRAVSDAFTTLRKVRDRVGVHISSSLNIVLCDGRNLVATRFCFDFGRFDEATPQGSHDYLSHWYTIGRDYGLHDDEWKMIGSVDQADSVLVASEPLTRDISTWLEVPEYSVLYASTEGSRRRADTLALDV